MPNPTGDCTPHIYRGDRIPDRIPPHERARLEALCARIDAMQYKDEPPIVDLDGGKEEED